MNHLTQEDLILIYYDEPGAADGAREHLLGCAQCRGAAESLAQTLGLCNDYRAAEPSAAFERTVWAQVAPQIEERRRGWFPWRSWVAVAVVALLIAGAFLMGRNSRVAAPAPLLAGLSAGARERILAISLADHLDRADRLLTEISNADEGSQAEFASESARAQDLVDEGRLLRQTLARQGPGATLNFLDDVERYMTEAVHASSARELRERMGSDSLLFKVRIVESNLRRQGQKS